MTHLQNILVDIYTYPYAHIFVKCKFLFVIWQVVANLLVRHQLQTSSLDSAVVIQSQF